MDFVNNYTEEFRRAQSLSRGTYGRQLPPPVRSNPKWKPPPVGCLKINCDSSLDLHAGKAGVGIIIRDHLGSVLECAALRKRAIDFVPTLEAMAIFYGLKLAVNRGADHIIVESDAEMLINNIKHGVPTCSVFGNFVDGILEFAAGFSSCSFVFQNRLGNKVAHSLARSCLSAIECKH